MTRSPIRTAALPVFLLFLASSGCDGEDAPTDASSPMDAESSRDADVDALAVCARNNDCDDGVWCNGAETCDPTSGGDGCVAGAARCSASEVCIEDDEQCRPGGWCVEGREGCMRPGDCDGDMEPAIECGGNDCDDNDAAVTPGNAEVCEFDDPRDEDCDPRTFGFVDVDGDGAADARCFNLDAEGNRNGGTDCNDNNAAISPLAAEVCVGVRDEDCDGSVDEDCPCTPEGSTEPCGSGEGVCAGAVQTCTASGWSECSVTPLSEVCDGLLDENCDGEVDEGCSCVTGTSQACGQGRCAGTQRCVAGAWDACDGDAPTTETCNGTDDDCDGVGDADDPDVVGVGETCGTDTGVCVAGTQSCLAGALTCGGPGHVAPGTETCDHQDQDCDGNFDNGAHVAACTSDRPPRRSDGPITTSWNYDCYRSDDDFEEIFCDGASHALLLTSGTVTDEPTGAAYIPVPMDLGRRSTYTATFRVSDWDASDGSPATGLFGIVLSPRRGTSTGWPLFAGPPRLDPGERTLFAGALNGFPQLWASEGETGGVLASGPLCSALEGLIKVWTVTFEIDGPSLRVEIESPDCPGGTAVSHTYPNFYADYYGESPSYPTYYVGALGWSIHDARIELAEFNLERQVAGASRNHCIGCP